MPGSCHLGGLGEKFGSLGVKHCWRVGLFIYDDALQREPLIFLPTFTRLVNTGSDRLFVIAKHRRLNLNTFPVEIIV